MQPIFSQPLFFHFALSLFHFALFSFPRLYSTTTKIQKLQYCFSCCPKPHSTCTFLSPFGYFRFGSPSLAPWEPLQKLLQEPPSFRTAGRVTKPAWRSNSKHQKRRRNKREVRVCGTGSVLSPLPAANEENKTKNTLRNRLQENLIDKGTEK